MVEMPAEETEAELAAQEIVIARPQAAVQGIPAGQPAPMRAPEVKQEATAPSIFGRLFGWFKKLGEEEKTQVEAPPAVRPPRPAQRQQQNRGRRERSEQPRPPRERTESRPSAPQQRGEAVAEKQSRPRAAQPARSETATEVRKQPIAPGSEKDKVESATESTEPRSKRSRRGGRRDRGERKPETHLPQAEMDMPSSPETSVAAIAVQAELPIIAAHQREPKPEPMPMAAVQLEAATPPQLVAAPSQSALAQPFTSAPQSAPAQVERPEKRRARIVETAAPAPLISSGLQQVETKSHAEVAQAQESDEVMKPKAAPRKKETAALPAEATSTGLQQVETQRDKIPSANDRVDETSTARPRPARTPRPLQPQAEPAEPLVQIETHK